MPQATPRKLSCFGLSSDLKLDKQVVILNELRLVQAMLPSAVEGWELYFPTLLLQPATSLNSEQALG